MSICLDLPMPPSVNSIWRIGKRFCGKRQMYLDPEYVKWRANAEKHLMASGVLRGHVTISGEFDAFITLDKTKRRGDVDNRAKCPLDLCQRIGVIANDKNCREVTTRWGEAPLGCRITITEIKAPAHDTSLCDDAMRKAIGEIDHAS